MVLNIEGEMEGTHIESDGFNRHFQAPKQLHRRKVIIDTDPGIDDMMAIFMAFQSQDIEVIGLTTVFGNVDTPMCTINALHLCEVAGFPTVPVAEGSLVRLKGTLPRIADFVHGADGLGNTFQAKPKGFKSEIKASDFLIQKVAEFPNEVTVVALGPLTNIAEAIQKDPTFANNLAQLVVLGGSFFASGNVNPPAEANIYGDPEAADIVFTSGANTVVIGLNLTTQVIFTARDLQEIRDSKGRNGAYLYDCCQFYKAWHIKSDQLDGIFLHDPTCMAALLDPSLFTYKTGALRVETKGICVGHTLLDMGLKNWVGENPWIGQPPVKVGWTVDVEGEADETEVHSHILREVSNRALCEDEVGVTAEGLRMEVSGVGERVSTVNNNWAPNELQLFIWEQCVPAL